MKRVLLCLLTLILLTMMAAFAEETGRLYPAMDDETGLWGYIDGNAEWAIPPQFSWAGEFRGDYAAATPEDTANGEYAGIIDRQGRWPLAPEYTIVTSWGGDKPIGGLDGGLYYIYDDEAVAFFDIPAGFFSGLVYDECLVGDDWMDSWTLERLIPAEKDGRISYVDRHTGEIAFTLPEEYNTKNCWYYYFYNGYAMILTAESENGIVTGGAPVFFDETGKIADLGGLITLDDDDLYGEVTPGGILRVKNPETELYGFYDLNREDFLIQPQFVWADDFSVSGYACVEMEDGIYGHIDQTGRVLARGFEEPYYFYGEYAEADGKLINTAGETVLTLPENCSVMVQADDGDRYGYGYLVSPEGLMEVFSPSADGIMNLQGEWVLPLEEDQWITADYAGYARFFSQGFQPIRRKANGICKYAWMNARGEFITEFIYDDAGVFLGELARFSRDGIEGYIDQTGREVFTWQEDEP